MPEAPETPKRETEFRWASIAGADVEIVELIEQDGRRGILTIGCPDPFWLGEQGPGVVLFANWIRRPEHFETEEARAIREAEYERYRLSRQHGWRGPR